MNENRTYGIEIELIHGDKHAMARAINAAGIEIEVEGYNHTTRNHWKIVPDGSVTGGYEVVSPKLQGTEGLRQIKIVCDTLVANGAKINKSCGLHVHHDARDYRAAQFVNLFNFYKRAEHIIDSMLPMSRRADNNRYCHTLQNFNYIPAGRYYKVNFQAFHVHGTVEFRHHSGSVEAEKIINWVLLTQRIMDRCTKAVKVGRKLNRYDFNQALGFIHGPTEEAQNLLRYIDTRISTFAEAYN